MMFGLTGFYLVLVYVAVVVSLAFIADAIGNTVKDLATQRGETRRKQFDHDVLIAQLAEKRERRQAKEAARAVAEWTTPTGE